MRNNRTTIDIKKIRKRATWMYTLGIIGLIYVLCVIIGGARCLSPCEGETCHTCLLGAFLFGPFWAIPLLPTIIFNFGVSPSVMSGIEQINTEENLVIKHRHDIGRRLAWVSPSFF